MPTGKHIVVSFTQTSEHVRQWFEPVGNPWWHLSVVIDAILARNFEESTRTQLPNGVAVRDVLDNGLFKHILHHYLHIDADFTIWLPDGADYTFKNVAVVPPDVTQELPKIFIEQGVRRRCLGWITPETVVTVTGVREPI